MPRVSVIMNVRNGAETLGQAIDSVLAQTCADWEIVVWDDCSTDRSAAVVQQFRDPRICYFRSERDDNLGQAREQALRRAQGEWLAFLDQDDIWLPQKLERQLALAAPGVGLIYGRSVAFYSDGREVEYDRHHEYSPLPEGDIFEALFRQGCFIAMSSAMISRAAWERIGSIPQAITITPDYYLYANAALHTRARAVQEVVCRYRKHEGSMSHTRHCQIHEECVWLVNSLASRLPPRLVKERVRKHYTVLAYHRMRHWKTAGGGGKLLLTRGSLGFLLTRPAMRAICLLLRSVRRPMWMRGSLCE
jgi:glycosyltransferase involved in cell wall biosynthesis